MQSDRQEGRADRRRACRAGVGWLLLVSLVVFLPMAAWAFSRHGWVGVAAAAVGVTLCFLSAGAALVVTAVTSGTPAALQGTLLGVALRTLMPLLATVVLVSVCRPLAEASLFGMVVVSYLVILAAETLLVVRVIQTGQSASTVF